ncbi:fibronectin type III domain-containing protein [Longispora sp. K20-0274]|uniref:fibronectin type III domain-containing protein n=1 Tax=Longispora sp. K20-0274 TaxID=3088255 RepID=UPI0039996E26
MVVTLSVTVAMLAAVALTVLGLGIADKAVAVYDSSSWVWSSKKGELGRINGVKGAVDTRTKIKDSEGHNVQITQSDRYLIIRDLDSGKISSLDLTTLQVAATMDTPAGAGISLVLRDDVAFIIDSAQGAVRQVDPLTLNPHGQPLRLPVGLRSGGFDVEGRLWLAVPSEGTVVSVLAAAKKGADPTVERTTVATDPRHDITLSVLDKGVAVLDQTAAALVTIRDDLVKTIKIPMRAPGAVSDRTSGNDIPVTVSDDKHVYVVRSGKVREFEVKADQGRALEPAVAWAGWFYVADKLGDLIYVIDGEGNQVDKIAIKSGGGGVDLDVRENHLFINPPAGGEATVIDDKHKPTTVPKFPNPVPGGDPPPPPPAPPVPPTPPAPVPEVPGAPATVTALAGNAEARVSWGAAKENLSPIVKYVIEGGPKPVEVGGSQQTATITGLTNGTTYTFQVHAVNGIGAGPKRASNPVTPSSQTPDPPAGVSGTANPDGTVKVTWQAANGQGHKISQYQVTAYAAGGATVDLGKSPTTDMTVPDRKLKYGTQYSFKVVSLNDVGGASKESDPSNTVVPFNKPSAVTNLNAATDTTKAGTVNVSWTAAVANGATVSKYVVVANGKTTNTTATSLVLTGLGNDVTVTVVVHAVNKAGDGPTATDTAKTFKKPGITGGNPNGTPSAVTIPFAVNDGGSPASCWIDFNGAGRAQQGSCNSYTFGGLHASTQFSFTVHASNPAGEDTWTASVSTDTVSSTVCGATSCGSVELRSVPCYWNEPKPATNGCSKVGLPNGSTKGNVSSGNSYTAVCQAQGQTITNNNGKSSATWILINGPSGQGYIPWVWFQTPGLGGC